MRFRLRTLLIVLALGPMLLSVTWTVGANVFAEYRRRQPRAAPPWQLSLPIQNYGDEWVILPNGQPSFRPQTDNLTDE
jgi:hypothetical protein